MLLKFQIFFGVLEIPDIFWGVNGRCLVRTTYEEKIRVPPSQFSKSSVPKIHFTIGAVQPQMIHGNFISCEADL